MAAMLRDSIVVAVARRLAYAPKSTLARIMRNALLLVFTYHVIKPKNRNHSVNKVTNKGYDR